MIKEIPMQSITIDDSYYINSFEKELIYLKSLDADRLLASFRTTKGLAPKKERYGGWESTEISGHTLGHYLTALSQAYATSKAADISERLNYIIDELAICQYDSGYLSAFDENLFDNVENKKPAWVPWYTMHKIIAGLINVYTFTNNKKAYDIVYRLGLWVYNRTSKWSESTKHTVLAVEYGGMNDCLYDLYNICNDDRILDAAHSFDEDWLFEELYNNHDVLNGKHANTTIPKFIGALNRYTTLGESEYKYRVACENFFNIVSRHHSYVTGGNSEWEHFGEPDILDGERTNCNCETCNTYNMLKLSKKLYTLTGDVKYADFYENTHLNAIMSSQHPHTGMSMYFQPMESGYFKVYGTPYDKFWCCTGTGMENFTKLNQGIYFYDDSKLYINRYISSSATYEKFSIIQKSSILENGVVDISILSNDVNKDVALRIPDWCNNEYQLYVNNLPIDIKQVNSYVIVGNIKSGDTIKIVFKLSISAHPLNDNKHCIAFKYGPTVLSASYGTDNMISSVTGVDVTIPTKDKLYEDYIIVDSPDEWIENPASHLIKTPDKVEFRLEGTDYIFTPHYSRYEDRYGIYFIVTSPNSDYIQKYNKQVAYDMKRREATVDSIPIGNDQYELSHNIQGELTDCGTFNGLIYRHAYNGGWFSYDMKTDLTSDNNYLAVTYFSGNCGRSFDIYIDDILFRRVTIEDRDPGHFYEELYELPSTVKSFINVSFRPIDNNYVGGIFDRLLILREKI